MDNRLEQDPAIIRERVEKAIAQNLAYANAGSTQGIAGEGAMPKAPSLRERVDSQLNRARRERIKAEHLEELSYLLDKHPDISRILDLLEEVRG